MTKRRAPFDPQVIYALAIEVGAEDLAFGFLTDYFDLLPRRRDRIINALRDTDPEAAMDAILSLKIASAMVGALDAEDGCLILQSLVSRGDLASAGAEASALGSSIDTLVSDAPSILASLQQHLAGSLHNQPLYPVTMT
jgi:hypothetical protein